MRRRALAIPKGGKGCAVKKLGIRKEELGMRRRAKKIFFSKFGQILVVIVVTSVLKM